MTRAALSAVALACVLGALGPGSEARARLQAAQEAAVALACGDAAVLPALNAQPFQWKAGLDVGVWVDRDGRVAGAAQGNPKPMFTFRERDVQSLFEGVAQWSDIPETGVTFRHVVDNASHTASHWFSVAWPSAVMTFRASDGVLRTSTCRVPPASLRAAAYTCAFQDVVNEASQSHTIAGAITLINTAHSYVNPHDGESYDTWGFRLTDWPLALTKLGAHEAGHLMGLADLPSRDADGAERPHVMKPFNGTNDAAPFGGAPRLAPVTACDRATILNHPSQQYQRWVCAGPGAVPPPPCSSGTVPVCRDPEASYPAPTWECDGN